MLRLESSGPLDESVGAGSSRFGDGATRPSMRLRRRAQLYSTMTSPMNIDEGSPMLVALIVKTETDGPGTLDGLNNLPRTGLPQRSHAGAPSRVRLLVSLRRGCQREERVTVDATIHGAAQAPFPKPRRRRLG